jgi:uncharacterized membrane protein YidH (DUF202 family)
MNEISIFALTLLAVPVFARFARVGKESMGKFHLIALGGIFLLLGEATRISAAKISIIGSILPVIDFTSTLVAYAMVLVGTLGLSLYYIQHPREI